MSAMSAIIGLANAAYQDYKTDVRNMRAEAMTYDLFGRQQADRDKQNRWMAPPNQITQLKAAGLSPASYYGGAAQGMQSAGIADAGVPEFALPPSDAFSSGVQGAVSSLTVQPTIQNLESQSNRNNAEAIESLFRGANSRWDLQQKRRMQAELDEKIRNDVRQGAANIRKSDMEIQRLEFDLDFDKEVRDYRKAFEKAHSDKERWDAFASEWNGKVAEYQRKYMDEHGRQVPADSWSALLEYLGSKTGLRLPDLSVFNQSPSRGFLNEILSKYGYQFDEKWHLQKISGGSR